MIFFGLSWGLLEVKAQDLYHRDSNRVYEGGGAEKKIGPRETCAAYLAEIQAHGEFTAKHDKWKKLAIFQGVPLYESLRFINRRDRKVLEERGFGQYAVDEITPILYGESAILSWRVADRILEEIPIGEFDPTSELIAEINQKSAEGIRQLKIRKTIGHAISLNGPGKIRTTPLSARLDAYGEPGMPDVQGIRANLEANEYLGSPKSFDFPWSEHDAYVYTFYTHPHKIREKLDVLYDWYHQAKHELHPIDLAADFQKKLVSIHPFIDGNGRTSRLFMSRILKEYGYPPPIFDELRGQELEMSDEFWREQVRQGVVRAYEHRLKKFNEESFEVGRLLDSIYQPGTDMERVLNSQRFNRLVAKGAPDRFSIHPVFRFDKKDFFLGKDGFLYNEYGIPHVHHNGVLFPIADQIANLYGVNAPWRNPEEFGESVSAKKREPKVGKDGEAIYDPFSNWQHIASSMPVKDATPAQRRLVKNHVELLEALEKGELDGSDIYVLPYSQIDQSNRKGKLQFYSWQKDLLESVADISGDSPHEILSFYVGAVNRNNLTSFESDFVLNTYQNIKIEPYQMRSAVNNVLAQYQKADFTYRLYEQAATDVAPELLPRFRRSRQKIHQAGRELLRDYFRARDKLSPEQLVDLRDRDSRVMGFEDFFEKSKLSYETFDEAIEELGDDHIYLLRSHGASAPKIGIFPEAILSGLLEKYPKYDRLRVDLTMLSHRLMSDGKFRDEVNQKLKEKIDRIPKPILDAFPLLATLPDNASKILHTFVGRFLKSKYSHHRLDPEYERTFIEYVLHASGGAPNKESSSTTSSPRLLFTEGTDVPFAPANVGKGATINLLQIPIDKVNWNYRSTFSSEYEFLASSWVPPWHIPKTYYGRDLKQLSLAPKQKGRLSLSSEQEEYLRVLGLIYDDMDNPFYGHHGASDEGDGSWQNKKFQDNPLPESLPYDEWPEELKDKLPPDLKQKVEQGNKSGNSDNVSSEGEIP